MAFNLEMYPVTYIARYDSKTDSWKEQWLEADTIPYDELIESLSKLLNLDQLENECFFESVITNEHPGVAKIKNILISCGARGALMSGSGPSVFGIFDDEASVKNALDTLINSNIRANFCKTI